MYGCGIRSFNQYEISMSVLVLHVRVGMTYNAAVASQNGIASVSENF